MSVSCHSTALLLIAAGALSGNARSADDPPGHHAIYKVYDRSRAVGVAEFSLTPPSDGSGIYEFRSTTRANGIYRLFLPRPLEEFSAFTLEGGLVRPLAYSLRDGTRRERDSFSIEFDWERGRAVIAAGEDRLEPELLPGTLDRGSLQVALMRLDDGFSVTQLTLLDKDGPEIHELRAVGEETLDTRLGQFRTRKLIQQRLGSSRRTLIWLAPDLHGLPIRIERQNDLETRAAFHLEEVRWIEEP